MRFPVLNTIGLILKGLGWLIVLFGIIAFISAVGYMVSQSGQTQYQFQQYGILLSAAPIAASIYAVILGLLLVAWGESILVLLAIEENTRTTPLEPAAQFLGLLVQIERNTRGKPNRVDEKAQPVPQLETKE